MLDILIYVEISANGHSYADWVETLAPTCTEIGGERRDCDNCDHYETRDVAALGHDEFDHPAQEPTCTSIGWHSYVTCSRCDYTTYVERVALGHDEIGYFAKDPTCTTVGWYAYVTCSRCDYTTYIEKAVLGHDEIAHAAQAPTCTEIGWHAYATCSRCDYTTYEEIAANGHDYTNKICVTCGEKQPPSYSWDISANGDGSVMAYSYALTGGKYLIELVGSGNTKDYSSSPFYSLSSKIDDIVIGDGITSLGNSLFKNLNIHGGVYIPDSVSSIGTYTFSAFSGPKTISLPAGITSIGNFAFYGSQNLIIILQGDKLPSSLGSIWDYNCGHYLNPQEVVTTEDAIYVIDRNGKLGHNEIGQTAKAPTCTEIGWNTYVTCSRCDYTTYVEIPANGHNYGDWISDIPATCEGEGILGHYHCVICGTDFDANKNILATLVIPANGHNEGEWIIDSNATCTTDGSKHKECTVCEKNLATDRVEMLGHDTTTLPAKAPTCMEIGWGEYEICSRCSYTTYIELPANGHSYGTPPHAGASLYHITLGSRKAPFCCLCVNRISLA